MNDHSFLQVSSFESQLVAPRNVRILLPQSYFTSTKKYPVLYLQDGQMLFDSTATWNNQEWGVDELMLELESEGAIRETIIIGIDNGGVGIRHAEYFPQKPFKMLETHEQDYLYGLRRNDSSPLFAAKVHSDAYLNFLVSELKTHIDTTYRTLPEVKDTFIGGSSMGALISLYAISEYPDIFGGAFCMSTHWPGVFTNNNNPIPGRFFKYLKQHLPDPKDHKLYFDYGTTTLDTLYEVHQLRVDSILYALDYDSSSLLSLKFEGARHDERSWQQRLEYPLTFLLKNKK